MLCPARQQWKRWRCKLLALSSWRRPASPCDPVQSMTPICRFGIALAPLLLILQSPVPSMQSHSAPHSTPKQRLLALPCPLLHCHPAAAPSSAAHADCAELLPTCPSARLEIDDEQPWTLPRRHPTATPCSAAHADCTVLHPPRPGEPLAPPRPLPPPLAAAAGSGSGRLAVAVGKPRAARASSCASLELAVAALTAASTCWAPCTASAALCAAAWRALSTCSGRQLLLPVEEHEGL